MAATHAFQLTVVNCPSQVRVFLRPAWLVAERENEEQLNETKRAGESLSVFFCHPTMARLLFRFLTSASTSTSTFPPPKKQDLAKTNLAFVSADDPATAYPFLEVNGW